MLSAFHKIHIDLFPKLFPPQMPSPWKPNWAVPSDILDLHKLRMEHWDAWLAEDVLKEDIKLADSQSEETDKPSSADGSSASSARGTPKSRAPINVHMWEVSSSSSSTVGGVETLVRATSSPPLLVADSAGRGKDAKIFLRQLLDGTTPVERLLAMEMPQELKDELLDWETKFPDLSVRGRPIGKSPEVRQVEAMRMAVAKRMVEEHVWPEIQSILCSKDAEGRVRKGSKKKKKKMGEGDKRKGKDKNAKTVRLPPIGHK